MDQVTVGDVQEEMAAVVDAAKQREWWRTIHVRDIMTASVICVDTATTVPDAYALMQEHKIRRLPVIDDGVLVGIVTLGDVRGALPSEVTTLNRTEQAYLMQQVKIDRVMTGDVITTTTEMTLADAARLLIQYKIGGLPVVADDQVVGMVTESDIFTAVVAMFDKLDQI